MQIERMYYPLETLGYGNRIGIWTIGCHHECIGCSNPELWQSNSQKDISLQTIFQMIRSINKPIDGVTITGGEPFLQHEDLAKLVTFLKKEITDDILVYSGYTLKQLQTMAKNHHSVHIVLNTISCLIDGKYVEEKNDNLPLRGSSNQEIHIFNKNYEYRYTLEGQRKIQNVYVNNDLIQFGIPYYEGKKHLRKGLEKYGITFED